jgi:hypothetical protein
MAINTNRLTIIVLDGAVYTDDKVYIGLDFSDCEIPNDVQALQWRDNQGEIEFTDTSPNLLISELPSWAIRCYDLSQSIPEDLYGELY